MTNIYPVSWFKRLDQFYPGTVHLSTVLPLSTEDKDIWSFAKSNGFAIVTKDDDFEQRSILFGHPPKVVWIRLGNCRTADIAELLVHSLNVILAFDSDDEKSYLPLP